ncbi:MAG: chromate transporter [Veillonellales bacterium]
MKRLLFFIIIFKAVVLSTGGFGPLPMLHEDFIGQGWATEKNFTEALAIGQIAPGPNGLWVVSLGKFTGGSCGAILAALALIIPPFLVLITRHFYQKWRRYPATNGILAGIVLVVSSFSIIVLGDIFFKSSPDIFLLLVCLLSAILAASRKLSANVILVASSFAGILFYGF